MNNNLKTDWNRYSHLNGDPLHLPRPIGFLKNADTQAVTAVAAFATAAAYLSGGSTDQITWMAAESVLGFATFQGLNRLFERFELRRRFNDVSKFCVDKQPTAHSMKTNPQNKLAALQLRQNAMFSLLFVGMLTPHFYGPDFVDAFKAATGPIADTASNGMFSSMFWLSWVAREGMNALRFHNVVTDKWNIVNPPPKEQRQEKWRDNLMPQI
jgi:hypothetical protein